MLALTDIDQAAPRVGHTEAIRQRLARTHRPELVPVTSLPKVELSQGAALAGKELCLRPFSCEVQSQCLCSLAITSK